MKWAASGEKAVAEGGRRKEEGWWPKGKKRKEGHASLFCHTDHKIMRYRAMCCCTLLEQQPQEQLRRHGKNARRVYVPAVWGAVAVVCFFNPLRDVEDSFFFFTEF